MKSPKPSSLSIKKSKNSPKREKTSRQNWLNSLVKGDNIWTFCWNGEADCETFDCWGNLNGSKGNGLYIENPFEAVFCSTKDIFQTKAEARQAGIKFRLKSLNREEKSLLKNQKRLQKEKQKLQKLLND